MRQIRSKITVSQIHKKFQRTKKGLSPNVSSLDTVKLAADIQTYWVSCEFAVALEMVYLPEAAFVDIKFVRLILGTHGLAG